MKSMWAVLLIAASYPARPITLAPIAASVRAVNPEADVRVVVGHYLHGLKFNDVASLRQAFWPDARLFWIKRDGSMGQLTQDEWYRGFATSAGKEEVGDLRIVQLDVTGSAASVKVVEHYPRSVYTDYLNLLRIGGEWRIVNKIYVAESH
jgi:hypothetical protein